MKALLRGTSVVLTALASLLAGSVASIASTTYSVSVTEGWAPNGGVNAIARHGDTVYLGGAFTRLVNTDTGVGVNRSGAAAIDATTGEVLPWNPGLDGTVRSIGVAPDGIVYLGGEFLSAAGQAAGRLAAVRPDGSLVPDWSATASDIVYDIVATGAGVFIGGPFGRVNGIARGGVARLDPATGALDRNFNARVTGGRVRALALAPDGRTLLLGGSFGALSGASRGFVGSVDVDTGAATDWAPAALCDRCHILDLAQGDGRAYAATTGPGGRAVAWSLASAAREWMLRADGDVQAIDYEDGVVVAGGHFGPVFADATRHQLAAISAGNGALLPYQLPFTGLDKPGIWAVLADESALRIGGYFQLNGTEQARYGTFPVVADPAAASPPTQVTAALVDKAVHVSWTAPSSDGDAVIERYEVSALPAQASVVPDVCTTADLTCLIPIGRGSLAEDAHYRFTVRAVTAAGSGAESDPSDSVTTDISGPAVSVDGARWAPAVGTSSSFAWTGSDPSGIDRYRVHLQRTDRGQAPGPWQTEDGTASTVAVGIGAGETVCIEVSGVDTVGNEGERTRAKCRTAPVDDQSAVTTGKTSAIGGARFYGHTATRIEGTSSLVRWRQVRASTTRLVASSCPKCGSARVYYGKKLVTTFSLRTSSAQHQNVYPLPRADRTEKITIRPGSDRRIMIDGLVLRPR